ncbi:hypothetical protein ALC62_08438 [Cyphomyrmex costatus]|uniref:Uncharacterized protein n=1 Tax=Cyphomyrmex costatus TaxID=456900 RepID=A0A195CJ52_9HYME|nr:hypothetical protein ALC62_08438 [Cyphomyrmex costatus]
MTSTMTTDPGSGPLRLRVSRLVVRRQTFKGGTNLKDEIHHHDQLQPPPTRRFTGRDDGMAGPAAAALAPPLLPGKGCTLGEPGGFLPQDISAGDCVTTTCPRVARILLIRDDSQRDEETMRYKPSPPPPPPPPPLPPPPLQQQWQHHQRGKRYVAGTPGKSRLHHPSSLPLTTLPDVFLSPSIFPSSDVTGMTFDRSLDNLQRPPPLTPNIRTQPVTRTAQRKGVIPRRMECTGELAVATRAREGMKQCAGKWNKIKRREEIY